MWALNSVLLSSSIWLLSVYDNRSCYHGGQAMGGGQYVILSQIYGFKLVFVAVDHAGCSGCTCMVLLGHTITESVW